MTKIVWIFKGDGKWQSKKEKNDIGVEFKGHGGKGEWVDGVRKSMISKDLTAEDAEDRELWRSKIALGWSISTVLQRIPQ